MGLGLIAFQKARVGANTKREKAAGAVRIHNVLRVGTTAGASREFAEIVAPFPTSRVRIFLTFKRL